MRGFAAISRSRRVIITTVASDDREYCDRLQNSLVRGEHELLYWGAGPKLYRGDIVGLFTPKSKYLPPSEHSVVSRLYVVAADSTEGTYWNQHVFLHRRLSLDRPIRFVDLVERVGLDRRFAASAGKRRKPMTQKRAVKFLREAAKRCKGGYADLERLVLDAQEDSEICISYSGADWTLANRIKLWLDSIGKVSFFVSPVGQVLSHERAPLRKLLKTTFERARIAICLLPSHGALSKWVQLEITSALEYAERVIFVRTNDSFAWCGTPKGDKVIRFTLSPTREGELTSLVRKELARSRKSMVR